MRKSVKTPVTVPAQELEIPVHMLVGEDDSNGWSAPPPRRRYAECEYIETSSRSSGLPPWAWLLIGILGVSLVGLLFWFAFSGVKDTVTNSAAATQALVTSTGANGIAATNAARDNVNANTTAGINAAIAQDNLNTGAVRGDLVAIKADVANEGSKTRKAIWSANARAIAATNAAKPDLSGLATKGDVSAAKADVSGLASKGDVDNLKKWMEANQAKVTVTPAPAPAAAPAAPAPAPAPVK